MALKSRRFFFFGSLAALTVVVPTQTQAENADAHNGFWWSKVPEEMKVGFVIGFADGAAAISVRWQLEQLKLVPAERSDSTGLAKFAEYGEISFGQLSKGLDEFYKDFRNTRIHVSDALPYVRDQIRGANLKKLEDYANALRQIASTPGYDRGP